MAVATLYAATYISGTVTTPAAATLAPNGAFTTDGNSDNSWTGRWEMQAPAGSNTASGTQTITLRVRKGSNSGNPTISSVTIWRAGTQIATATLSTGSATVSSTTGADVAYTVSGASIGDMSGVRIEVATAAAGGSPSARNGVELDAITWAANYDIAGDPGGVPVNTAPPTIYIVAPDADTTPPAEPTGLQVTII